MKNYPLYPVDCYNDFKSFAKGISKFGENTAITVFANGDVPTTYSYSTMTEDIRAFGEALLAEGYAKKHIAIASENRYEFIVSLIAIAAAGAVAVPVDIEQSVSSIEFMIRFADTDCLIASPGVHQLIKDVESLKALPHILIDGKNDSWEAFLQRGKELLKAGGHLFQDANVSPEHTAIIVYTSGTSSKPKPVMLSQCAIIQNACDSNAFVDLHEKVFTSLPLHHTYGLTCSVLNNLIKGRNICINGDIKRTTRDMALFNPDTIMAVPLIAEMLYKRMMSEAKATMENSATKGMMQKLFQREDAQLTHTLQAIKQAAFPGLKLIISGGAHLSKGISLGLMRAGILVLQGYGITECSPLISVNRNLANCPASVGLLLPSYEMKLDDDGEICVKGPCVMQGYYKMPELTEEALIDGWFRTGDLGKIDKQGFLHISGRCKNLIVLKSGKKISPEELEAYLAPLPLIKEVVAHSSVTGSGADDVMPAITVYPEPVETQGMTSYEILENLQHEVDLVNQTLPAYKQIRFINLRDTEFEKTSAKKIKRQNI